MSVPNTDAKTWHTSKNAITTQREKDVFMRPTFHGAHKIQVRNNVTSAWAESASSNGPVVTTRPLPPPQPQHARVDFVSTTPAVRTGTDPPPPEQGRAD